MKTEKTMTKGGNAPPPFSVLIGSLVSTSTTCGSTVLVLVFLSVPLACFSAAAAVYTENAQKVSIQ